MAARCDLRLFIDSNIIISGFFSPQGPPGKILALHASAKLTIVVCQLLLEEVVHNTRRKKPLALPALQSFLVDSPPEIVKNPPVEDIRRWTKYLHFEDAVIFSAAISAEPDYFVTGDNHFFSDATLIEKSGLRIVTPGEAIKLLNL